MIMCRWSLPFQKQGLTLDCQINVAKIDRGQEKGGKPMPLSEGKSPYQIPWYLQVFTFTSFINMFEEVKGAPISNNSIVLARWKNLVEKSSFFLV
jgi:hypothetical protein